MGKTFFLEGHGCSLNQADTEQILGFLKDKGFRPVQKPESAEIIIINACAVKEQTENKMLARIRNLWETASKNNSLLIVFGCLSKINPSKIPDVSKKIIILGPKLSELARILKTETRNFSPEARQEKSNKFISIIPIARGCLGNCSFCATKNARGKLKSYSIESIVKKISSEKKPCEIWLTAQDTACYGIDIGTTLPGLLKEILKIENDFRIRIGMMNPKHAQKIMKEYLPLFKDKRLYRFFHLPLQSGSDKILKKMNRPYSSKDFVCLVKKIKYALPDAAISTDVIAGFPGETEADFEKTLGIIRKTRPDIINISRFGPRPNTGAEKMPGQLHGREKKKRSRILTELQKKIALKNKQRLLGTEQEIFVAEKGKNNSFVGRNPAYVPVVIKDSSFGAFERVKIVKAFFGYVFGEKQ